MKTKNSLIAIFISALMISLFSVPQESRAQNFDLYSEADIIVETIPEIPGPNEEVVIKLESYSFNLNNYYIAWFQDGEQRSADYGNWEYVFRTGESGDVTNITAVIEVGSRVFRKELRFAPSEIDLLWEVTDGYAPPFYKGKVLPLRQSTIRITAVPETQLFKPTDAPSLIYYWENNYQRDSRASGFGKQSYTIKADALNFNEKISVTANDRGERSFARNTLNIPTNVYSPKILFYETTGTNRVLTNRALNTLTTSGKSEIRISFHPLNFSTTEINFTDLFVQWNINGEDQAPQNFEKQNELAISSGNQSGSVPISVTLEGINNILQESTEQINLFFNN